MRRSRLLLLLLISCFGIAFFLLAYPIYVIRPFRYQGARELAVALQLLRYRPALEALISALAALFLVYGWRTGSNLQKSLSLTLTLLVLLCAGLCRVNIYEKMFHPLDKPSFSKASGRNLDGGEEVLSIHVDDLARAYPIRILSYHHIVNDTLNGRAIVATY
jgi:hypothetical protein